MTQKDVIVAKALVVGDAATGKTSLIRRYVHNKFVPNHEATIGVDFSLKVLQDNDQQVNLQLWDIAGSERFTGLSRIYYRDAVAAFIVFDVTNVKSFQSVEKWKRDLDSKVMLPSGDHIPVILIANKVDLRRTTSQECVISDAELSSFARFHNFDAWFLTSAKSSQNVREAFESILTSIIARSNESNPIERLESHPLAARTIHPSLQPPPTNRCC